MLQTLAAEPSAWTFGWEALVAIGTIGLAFATAYLAWSTRRVARETQDVAKATQEEILADWRPVLLLDEVYADPQGLSWPAISLQPDRASIFVTNCGRGPALDASAELHFTTGVPVTSQEQRLAIAPGGSAQFSFVPPDGGSWATQDITQMGRLTYGDLAYSGYLTTYAIKAESKGQPFLDWQRVDRDPTYQAPLYGP